MAHPQFQEGTYLSPSFSIPMRCLDRRPQKKRLSMIFQCQISAAWFLLLGLSLVGCGGVYRITKVSPPATPSQEKPREKQDGILYYAKVGVCRHETKYEEPIFDIIITNTDSKTVELSRSLGLKAYVEFQAKLLNKAADAKTALNDEPAYSPTDFKKAPVDDNLLLIGN